MVYLKKSMFDTGPEITIVAVAVLSAPDADICLVVAAGYTVIADITAVVIIIVAEHTGG